MREGKHFLIFLCLQVVYMFTFSFTCLHLDLSIVDFDMISIVFAFKYRDSAIRDILEIRYKSAFSF